MTELRTSETHPLQIAELAAPNGGYVGVTFCPGKTQTAAWSGSWARSLDADVAAIRHWGADVVVTLVTEDELVELRVERLGEVVAAHGLKWMHCPILDVQTPTEAWEATWANEHATVHAALDRGGRVLAHCRGGLGRAGMVGALILVERGMEPAKAITAIRRVRPGAIQTPEQAAFVAAHRGRWTASQRSAG